MRQKTLRLRLGAAYHEGNFVCTWEDGQPINTFASRFRALAKKAGVPIHFHQLRHTAAPLMLEAGVPLKNASELLGHSTVAITGDVYGHVHRPGSEKPPKSWGMSFLRSELVATLWPRCPVGLWGKFSLVPVTYL